MGTDVDDCSALSPAEAVCEDDEVDEVDGVDAVVDLAVRITETVPEAEPEAPSEMIWKGNEY